VVNQEHFDKIFHQEDKGIISMTEYNKVKQELEKYKIAIKYFQDNGFADIVKNLLSY
jgi:hypothetical protein